MVVCVFLRPHKAISTRRSKLFVALCASWLIDVFYLNHNRYHNPVLPLPEKDPYAIGTIMWLAFQSVDDNSVTGCL
jgi:hypothetical protein